MGFRQNPLEFFGPGPLRTPPVKLFWGEAMSLRSIWVDRSPAQTGRDWENSVGIRPG